MDKTYIQDLKNKLGDKASEIIATGMNLRKWNTRNKTACCPSHKDDNPSFSWYSKGNLFKCFSCGATIDIIDYYTTYRGMTFLDAIKELCKETGTAFEDDYKSPYDKAYKFPKKESEKLTKSQEYLALRKISLQTLQFANVGEDNRGNIAFQYFDTSGKLVMIKYRPSRKIEKGETKTWCQKDTDKCHLLYGVEKIDITKTLIICEGEIDRLSLIEAGLTNSVSVPFGANNYQWMEFNWDWLENFEDIILWTDKDTAGEKMLADIIPRLGEHRCKIVTGLQNDVNLQLYKHGVDSIRVSVEKAKDVPILNVKCMSDVEDYDINKAEKIKSGINGLDKWIGGWVLGTVNVITGINGSGKSTFINQICICEALNQGYKTFIYSGELTKPQLRSWIEYPLAGVNVKEIDNGINQPKGYIVPKEVKEQMRNWYRGGIYIYDNELDTTAKTILSTMEKLARKHGVKNFVLDNLMMIDLECNSHEQNRVQKEFMLSLIRFATRFQCVIHLVAHPRKLEMIKRLSKLDVCGSGDITNLAHYVTAIHRVSPQEKEPVTNKKGDIVEEGCEWDCIIDLFKNRPLGHQDKSIGVFYENKSKRFYGDSDNVNKNYNWVDSESNFTNISFEECPI